MSDWSAISLQDAASPLMEQLAQFHDHTLIILILVTTLVAYMMFSMLFNVLTHRLLLEHQQIEIIWTILPAIMLIFIAMPSLRLVYLLEEIMHPQITVKAVGHQWYWTYEYSDFESVEFDSFMIQTNSSSTSEFRLLDVDNRTVLPINTQTRVMATSTDVIHSWTVPALGVKADAVPGRVNQMTLEVDRPGLFFGQCSEICGANHSFMPIVIESVTALTFMEWVLASISSSE